MTIDSGDNPEPNVLRTLCAGMLPHVAARIRRAYWIGAADGLAFDRRHGDAQRRPDRRHADRHHVPD